ncbi:hypothetical protein CHX27_09205 [Flavobacterium aurantiibacter]|uniref:Uncharacterized protein n=1 Tax=Flavobacterium aurantiibacter TaxID=2023067 RepID=A0A255ZQG7_9FLAO|nr:hypothetical protein CHX27_09205 [Flavobacterium aurantiibacter]
MSFIIRKSLNLKYYFLPLALFLFFIAQILIQSNILALFIFLLFLAVAFYFVPYSLVKSSSSKIKGYYLISKLIFAISSAYFALVIYTQMEILKSLGHILVISSTLFSYYLWLKKNDQESNLFKVHFLVATVLIGVIEFQY